jgi:hypothetical protein
MEIYEACKIGHVPKFLFLYDKDPYISWDLAIFNACESGSINMLNTVLGKYYFTGRLRINYMVDDHKITLNNCLYQACYKGRYEIVERLLKENFTINYNEHLYASCRGGHLKVINLMISKGANNYNLGLSGSLENNHFETADYMVSLGANVNEIRKEYKIKYQKYKDIENLYSFHIFNDDMKSIIRKYLISSI